MPLAIKEYMMPRVEEERRTVLAVKELSWERPLMGGRCLGHVSCVPPIYTANHTLHNNPTQLISTH